MQRKGGATVGRWDIVVKRYENNGIILSVSDAKEHYMRDSKFKGAYYFMPMVYCVG